MADASNCPDPLPELHPVIPNAAEQATREPSCFDVLREPLTLKPVPGHSSTSFVHGIPETARIFFYAAEDSKTGETYMIVQWNESAFYIASIYMLQTGEYELKINVPAGTVSTKHATAVKATELILAEWNVKSPCIEFTVNSNWAIKFDLPTGEWRWDRARRQLSRPTVAEAPTSSSPAVVNPSPAAPISAIDDGKTIQVTFYQDEPTYDKKPRAMIRCSRYLNLLSRIWAHKTSSFGLEVQYFRYSSTTHFTTEAAMEMLLSTLDVRAQFIEFIDKSGSVATEFGLPVGLWHWNWQRQQLSLPVAAETIRTDTPASSSATPTVPSPMAPAGSEAPSKPSSSNDAPATKPATDDPHTLRISFKPSAFNEPAVMINCPEYHRFRGCLSREERPADKNSIQFTLYARMPDRYTEKSFEHPVFAFVFLLDWLGAKKPWVEFDGQASLALKFNLPTGRWLWDHESKRMGAFCQAQRLNSYVADLVAKASDAVEASRSQKPEPSIYMPPGVTIALISIEGCDDGVVVYSPDLKHAYLLMRTKTTGSDASEFFTLSVADDDVTQTTYHSHSEYAFAGIFAHEKLKTMVVKVSDISGRAEALGIREGLFGWNREENKCVFLSKAPTKALPLTPQSPSATTASKELLPEDNMSKEPAPKEDKPLTKPIQTFPDRDVTKIWFKPSGDRKRDVEVKVWGVLHACIVLRRHDDGAFSLEDEDGDGWTFKYFRSAIDAMEWLLADSNIKTPVVDFTPFVDSSAKSLALPTGKWDWNFATKKLTYSPTQPTTTRVTFLKVLSCATRQTLYGSPDDPNNCTIEYTIDDGLIPINGFLPGGIAVAGVAARACLESALFRNGIKTPVIEFIDNANDAITKNLPRGHWHWTRTTCELSSCNPTHLPEMPDMACVRYCCDIENLGAIKIDLLDQPGERILIFKVTDGVYQSIIGQSAPLTAYHQTAKVALEHVLQVRGIKTPRIEFMDWHCRVREHNLPVGVWHWNHEIPLLTSTNVYPPPAVNNVKLAPPKSSQPASSTDPVGDSDSDSEELFTPEEIVALVSGIVALTKDTQAPKPPSSLKILFFTHSLYRDIGSVIVYCQKFPEVRAHIGCANNGGVRLEFGAAMRGPPITWHKSVADAMVLVLEVMGAKTSRIVFFDKSDTGDRMDIPTGYWTYDRVFKTLKPSPDAPEEQEEDLDASTQPNSDPATEQPQYEAKQPSEVDNDLFDPPEKEHKADPKDPADPSKDSN